jgi:hypothetical protein
MTAITLAAALNPSIMEVVVRNQEIRCCTVYSPSGCEDIPTFCCSNFENGELTLHDELAVHEWLAAELPRASGPKRR